MFETSSGKTDISNLTVEIQGKIHGNIKSQYKDGNTSHTEVTGEDRTQENKCVMTSCHSYTSYYHNMFCVGYPRGTPSPAHFTNG